MCAGILKEPVQTKPESVRDSARHDVDQDVFLMFNVVDENLSWYLDENIASLPDPSAVNQEDPDFEESNMMHGERCSKTNVYLTVPSQFKIFLMF